MNVLHVIGSLDQRSGGPLRAVLDLSAMALSLGLRSELLGFGPARIQDNPLRPELIHSLHVQGPTSYAYAPHLRQWCRKHLREFDGVMLHGLWSSANWTVSRECRAAGVPYIVFPHGMLDLWSVRGQGWWKRIKKTGYWHWREKRVVHGGCATFFTLQRELDNARKTFALPAIHPLIVVPYGVMPQKGDPAEKHSSQVDQGPDRRIALFLGRVHPKKRPDILIEAWAAAKVSREWKLVIAGPGEATYLEHLVELGRRRGVGDSVQFTGPVAGADKSYLFHRASWFLLPSEQENFGIAVLEAASSGCALAISDQVYLADELPDGSEVLPIRVEPWTRFMRERMTDDAWHDETVKRVREHLGDRFSAQRVGQEWVAVIERVLLGRQSALQEQTEH